MTFHSLSITMRHAYIQNLYKGDNMLEEARRLFPEDIFTEVDNGGSDYILLIQVLFNMCIYQQKEIEQLKKSIKPYPK